MIPTANQIYKHFKGNLYRIIAIAKHSETGEDMVVYQALYGEYAIYTRPLASFTEVLDNKKYPDAKQKYRFEPVREMVEPVMTEWTDENRLTERKMSMTGKEAEESIVPEEMGERYPVQETVNLSKENITQETGKQQEECILNEKVQKAFNDEEQNVERVTIDPMLEAYLDTDSYRERLNILHGLQHRITEHMLLTMAVVIDFELPEGSIEQKYDALHDCLLTREKYECNRMHRYN